MRYGNYGYNRQRKQRNIRFVTVPNEGSHNWKDFLKAFQETCWYRNFNISKSDALILIDEISNNQQINIRWMNYCKNVKYIDNLPFKDVILSIKEWIESISE